MRRHPTAGFTLIELGLAVSVGVLLLGVLFSFYVIVARMVDNQHTRRHVAEMDYALDQIARDLLGARQFHGHEVSGFQLETEQGPRGTRARFTFPTVRQTELFSVPGQDKRWVELVEVVYSLDYTPNAPGRLLRKERPLVGPGVLQGVQTNVVVTGVDRFIVKVRFDDEWQDHADISDDESDEGWPVAARIRLESDLLSREDAREMDVLIPAGWVIERPERPQER